jgi:hypothetical protein
MHRVPLIVGLLMAALAILPVEAQEPAAPSVGSRVRVYAPAEMPDTVIGDLLDYADRALTVRCIRGDTLILPYGSITSLEVRRTRSHAVRGAVTGLLMGATVGALGGAVGPGCGAHDCKPTDERMVRGMVSIGLVGGAVGLFVGVASSGETWESIPLGCLDAPSGP